MAKSNFARGLEMLQKVSANLSLLHTEKWGVEFFFDDMRTSKRQRAAIEKMGWALVDADEDHHGVFETWCYPASAFEEFKKGGLD